MQVGVDGLKERGAELMGFQPMPKVAARGLIRHGFHAEINPRTGPHRSRVVQGLLYGGLRQIEPLLEKINAPHPLQPHGAASRAVRLRIHRLDHCTQTAHGTTTASRPEKDPDGSVS